MLSPFIDAKDRSLLTAHTLLLNLGSRMLTGLKNQTTVDEHRAILLCVKALEIEIESRGIIFDNGTEKESGKEASEDVNNVSH